ncbi:aminoglycoside 2'-N-acetyltransferase [Streptomyces carminius]|uniref:Aminoglycoside 2'-N-acetyltransferase n=1 Tax=Streptomyces carminius TaxID=2665496 RepID=A0A2M8LTL2_9ACTN|nr:GNAT family N-acetyltransferase [Streptomyces carminius]PJE95285.1 aminoglycoside 2'-N-acetyltransferase [Streptomyces carminius]
MTDTEPEYGDPVVRVLHTAALGAADRAAVRALLEEVFEGDFGDHDWDHTLGGVHALVLEGGGAPEGGRGRDGRVAGRLVAHGSLVQRRLLHGGRALRTGYVEGVGVRADRRGLGYGAAVLAALEEAVRGAYELGALSSSEEALGFYAARGWLRWQGPTLALTPGGVVRTGEDDGGVFVLPVAARVDLTGELVCDWRDGDLW